MTSRLIALAVDANDPLRLARFWATALRWEVADQTDEGVSLLPTDGTRFSVEFYPVPEPKEGVNRLHLDLTTTSADDQRDTVRQLIELGGRHIDIGQGDVTWVVMADPDGNEFCVLSPRG